ncbi:MAG: hypothetical protein U9N07_09785 [Euryarchaeota archaeon]|nr:hypothetical protein [Euryarchaeota archaeon]
MLFNKKEDQKPVSESLLNKFMRDIYELGYEIGYHHHSEIGWVSDAYNSLIEHASVYGIEDTLREYYIKGKAEGTERRRHDFLTQGKVAASKRAPTPTVRRPSPAHRMVAQPAMTDTPRTVERPRMVERPKALEGFIPVKST